MTTQTMTSVAPLISARTGAQSLSFDIAALDDLAIEGESYTALLVQDGLGVPTAVSLPLVEGTPAAHLFVRRTAAGYPGEAQWDLASYSTSGVATYRRPTPLFRMAGTPAA